MKPKDYITKCYENPAEFAAVPKTVASEVLEVSLGAITQKIRAGTLDAIRLKGKNRTATLVFVESIYKEIQPNIAMGKTVTRFLEKSAKLKILRPYGEIMATVDFRSNNPNHRMKIGKVLGAISQQSFEEHDFMLSALAVR